MAVFKKIEYELSYKTSTTPFFPIELVGKNYSRNFKQLCGLDDGISGPLIVIIYQGIKSWFFPKSLVGIGKQVLERMLITHPRYFTRMIAREKEISAQLFRAIRTPIKSLFDEHKALTQRGVSFMSELFDTYAAYGYAVDVPGYLFQLYYVDVFKDYLFQDTPSITYDEREDIFQLLLSSYKLTNYERFLLALYGHVEARQNVEHACVIAERFSWLVHDYLGDVIDVSYVSAQLRDLKRESPESRAAHKREMRQRLRRISVVKKRFSSKTQNVISRVQELNYLYNERKKEVLNPVNMYFRQVIEHGSGIRSVKKLHQLYQFSSREILAFLSGSGVGDLAERSQSYVYEILDGDVRMGDGRYVSFVARAAKTHVLHGTPASPGKATGQVSVILNMSQIGTFRKGDILVAPFTNVNYLPIMRKARAILTEVGGLTSHAAAVSRELGIPCIVGIKDIFSSLNDGDMVDVDAKRGIVKIL